MPWGYWTTSSTTTISNVVYYNNYQVWTDWNANSTGYGTSTNLSTSPWGYWVVGTPYVDVISEPTPEEVEAARVAWRDAEALRVAAALVRVAEEAEARIRAEALLLDHLTPDQRDEYRRDGRFHLLVGERRYRITRGRSGNVRLIEERAGAEVEVESYCIHPEALVPDEDTMLAQKLLLEADEAAFRRIANITRRVA